MAKYDFFISYSSKDTDIAFKIVNALEAEGHTCWIAPRNIPYGIPYARAIMEGIDECNRFIVLITKNSVQSDDVLNEVDNAHSLKKTIIPVKLTNIQLSRELNYYLSRTQWLTLPLSNIEEIVKLLNINIDSSIINGNQANNTSTQNGRKRKTTFIIALIAVIGLILGIGLIIFGNSKENDENMIPANENLQGVVANVSDDSLKPDENLHDQIIETKQSTVNKRDDYNSSMGNANKSKTTSNDYEKLLIDANTFYNDKAYEKALKIYEEIANNFDINYADKVGYMYYNGLGTKKNPYKAIEWGEKAADNGNHDAQIRVGYMLLRAEQYKEAAKYYHEAEKYIPLNPEANNDLGYLYFNGLGVSKDIQLATKYWVSAANSGVVNSQVALGNMYYLGDGVKQNYKEAYKWYSMAAHNGELNSQYVVAYMYENGLGVEKNLKEAVRYYKSAAEKGHKGAVAKYNSLKELDI